MRTKLFFAVCACLLLVVPALAQAQKCVLECPSPNFASHWHGDQWIEKCEDCMIPSHRYGFQPCEASQAQAAYQQGGQVQQPRYQKPAAPAPLFRTAGPAFQYVGGDPLVVTEPQYLNPEQDYDNADFAGYYILGFPYGYGTLGSSRVLNEIAPSAQNLLDQKLRGYGLNVLQGATGASAYGLQLADVELGTGKNAGQYGVYNSETPLFLVQTSYALAVKKTSVRSFNGVGLAGMVYQGSVFTNSRRALDWIMVSGSALSRILLSKVKVDMKIVMYAKLVNERRQILYSEKAAIEKFTVSETQFRDILGFGSASHESVRGDEIAEKLVEPLFNYQPTREQQIVQELKEELAEREAKAKNNEEIDDFRDRLEKVNGSSEKPKK